MVEPVLTKEDELKLCNNLRNMFENYGFIQNYKYYERQPLNVFYDGFGIISKEKLKDKIRVKIHVEGFVWFEAPAHRHKVYLKPLVVICDMDKNIENCEFYILKEFEYKDEKEIFTYNRYYKLTPENIRIHLLNELCKMDLEYTDKVYIKSNNKSKKSYKNRVKEFSTKEQYEKNCLITEYDKEYYLFGWDDGDDKIENCKIIYDGLKYLEENMNLINKDYILNLINETLYLLILNKQLPSGSNNKINNIFSNLLEDIKDDDVKLTKIQFKLKTGFSSYRNGKKNNRVYLIKTIKEPETYIDYKNRINRKYMIIEDLMDI